MGSGFIVDADGYLITNNHVIQGAQELIVKLSDGRQFPGTLVGSDPQNDLAVVRIDTGADKVRFSALTFAEGAPLDVGEWVVAIGSPFGLDNSVTQGIVSAKGRTITPGDSGMSFEDYVQTDAAINPGNSGGPLLNLEGQVVGVNSAIASRSGGYDGLGFAIPANVAKGIYENIRSNGRLVRGWLGADFYAASRRGTEGPMIIQSIVEGSPADQAGIREGDVITRVWDQPATPTRYNRALNVGGPGSKVELEVTRDGKPRDITLTMADAQDYRAQIAKSMGVTEVKPLAVSVRTVDAAIARSMGYNARVRGVVVVDVNIGGRAEDELEPNDIIAGINDQDVTNAEDLEALLKDADFTRGVRINVIREGMRGYVEVKD